MKRWGWAAAAAFVFVVIATRSTFDLYDEPRNRAPASEQKMFIDAERSPVDPKMVAREVNLKTGIEALRARKVRYDSERFRDALWPAGRIVAFQPFSDIRFNVKFMTRSPLEGKWGQFVGQVEGDPDSRVHLWTTQESLTGEIVMTGHTFRFTPAGGGLHYVIELKERSSP